MGAAPADPSAASFSGRVNHSGRRLAVQPLPPEEARVRAIAEIVNALIAAVKEGRDVDLNVLKTEVGAARSSITGDSVQKHVVPIP